MSEKIVGRLGERPDRAALAVVLLAALVYSVLNALKPLHIDDSFTWYVSKQILKSPLDPFGFEIFWYQWPQPCAEDLLAPVVAYWGALGLLVSGSSDFLWKLTLLPLVVLFAVSFQSLARRFAPGLETLLTLLALFSPAFLPSANYMQDVPALAIGLAAIALYLRAEERGVLAGAIAAGVLAGVAMQTKYTAWTVPVSLGLHALLWRRLRFGIAAGITATALFVAWEAFLTWRYGLSMFAANVTLPLFWSPRGTLALPGVQLLGATLPAFALLGLAALGLPRAVVLALAAASLAGHAALLTGPHQGPLFLASGAVVLTALGAVVFQRLRQGDAEAVGDFLARRRTEVFLVAWLLLEAFSYFQLSYFPAVRRVLPLTLPAMLLFGRAAALAAPSRRLPLLPLAAFQLVLALGYWGVDLVEARTQRDAARAAFEAIRARDPVGRIWFVGHWGFQVYAERLGMQPLIPDYSEVARGDWVVVPSRVDQQSVVLAPERFEPIDQRLVPSVPPLWTSYGFYASGTPLEHATGPRLATRILRARETSIPPSGWSPRQLSDWAVQARGRQAGWARRALARELEQHPKPGARRLAAKALAALGPLAAEVAPALERAAAGDPDAEVRGAAAAALLRVRVAP